MIKRNTIPTIIGLIVLIAGTFAGVLFLKSSTIFKIGADASAAAKNIRVANIDGSSATVSWTTDKETQDFLIWGTSQSNVTKTENEDADGKKYFNHSITLTGLLPNTNYFYKISSDGITYDNGGIPWQLTTAQDLGESKNSILVSGTVINASGTPEKRALVYANISGYLMSTVTSDTGNFVFQIGNARTNDLQNFADIDPAKTLVQLSVQAAPDGIASAQIYPHSANPVPPIIIGQTYDFRNEPANSSGQNPDSNLNLPQNSGSQSKFNITIPNGTPKPTSVILESLSEGETISTNKPQFFGKAPSGTKLTITIHSQNSLSGNVSVPSNGSWSFTTPSSLLPGNHTITVSWIDASGITRFLTRDFVVQASEAPAFTASSSGRTPSPSPKPTTTTILNSSPSPTPKPTIIATPKVTSMPVPVTGDLTPTLLLSIMGIAVLAFSFIVWKIAEN